MNTTHPAHIDAVARVIYHGTGGGNSQCVTSSKVCAEIVLDSTDPAVHAAMLDALTRHGVLDRVPVCHEPGFTHLVQVDWQEVSD